MATRFDEGTAESPMPLLGANAGWGWILAYGIVSVVVGILAFLAPVSATIAATWGIGIALMIVGVAAIVAGARGRGAESRGYKIVFGIITALIGLWMVSAPIAGAVSLTMFAAIWLMVRGVLEIVAGSRYRRHRAAMIALGVVNVLLAIYVWVMLPVAALTLPGFILGVSFLSGGALAIAQALSHRRV